MSKPLIHSKIAAKKYGGQSSDYIRIDSWFDSTKAHIPDARHRLLLHNSFGIYLAEQLFGELVVTPKGDIIKMPYITNSDNIQVSIRDIAELHVLHDIGRIMTLEECFRNMPIDAAVASGVMAKVAAGNFILVD